MRRMKGEPMFTGTDGKKHRLSKFRDGTYELTSQIVASENSRPKYLFGQRGRKRRREVEELK